MTALANRRTLAAYLLSPCVAFLVGFLAIGHHAARIASAEPPLVILPKTILLSTTQARQRLIVERSDDGHYVGQVTEPVAFTSSDARVVKIEDGQAVPAGNGTATLTAKLGNQTATAEVKVTGQDKPFTWSFRNHVESVFSKSGCNAGSCHGALAGKNGFRLTLFGYNPDADFLSITRQARGRRIVPSDPGLSLLLLKPTGTLPHKGGVRLDVGSLEYRVLAEWIASAAPEPQKDDPRLARLQILPEYSRQAVGRKQQYIVLAHFTDGHVEDVTHWAKYTTVNSTVATADKGGAVQVVGPGEGAIKAWYLNANVLAFLSVPYQNKIEPEVFARAERRNFIDELILAKLKSLNLPPSPPADDATLIRRMYLDTIGLLPTAEEVRTFLAEPSPDKQDRLIDHLLSRPEFVDYWAYKWSDLLLVSGRLLRPKAVKTYYAWIRQQVARNTPWDQFARQVVTANGSTLSNGAANFYALHQSSTDISETICQAFLGLSVNCAKCHNHPLEKWTNDQYYGMANLFARVRGKGWGNDAGDGDRVVYSDTQGELLQPSKGKPQQPRPLDGRPISFEDTADRREHVARWLTTPENPYFTRAITNRVWANFFGVGLVEKVDDLRLTNPPSNEQLLAAASSYLADHKYDLKALMRAILRSAAYQRSSKPLPGNRDDTRFYTRYYPRRLKAEVILDAISQVTDVPSQFKDYPAGTRAIQLADTNVQSYFLSTFGRPERIITCECERSNEPSMVQVLHMCNGKTLLGKLASKNNRIDKLLAAQAAYEPIVQDLYLIALARYPTAEEKGQIFHLFAQSKNVGRRVLLEDLFWGVLSSKEFLFNH